MFRKTRDNNSSDCSGRTMLEMIAVLGLIATMAASAYGVISTVYGKFKLFKSRRQLKEVVEMVRKYYVNDFNYDGISVTTAINEGLAPQETIRTGKIILATGAEITEIAPVVDLRAFSLTFKSSYEGECGGLMETFIDQQYDQNKAAYKVVHSFKDIADTVATYSWTGDKDDCTEEERHFVCMTTAGNYNNCEDASEVQAFYY